jgi:hypothetical protein
MVADSIFRADLQLQASTRLVLVASRLVSTRFAFTLGFLLRFAFSLTSHLGSSLRAICGIYDIAKRNTCNFWQISVLHRGAHSHTHTRTLAHSHTRTQYRNRYLRKCVIIVIKKLDKFGKLRAIIIYTSKLKLEKGLEGCLPPFH